jgi:hypothetical protein
MEGTKRRINPAGATQRIFCQILNSETVEASVYPFIPHVEAFLKMDHFGTIRPYKNAG